MSARQHFHSLTASRLEATWLKRRLNRLVLSAAALVILLAFIGRSQDKGLLNYLGEYATSMPSKWLEATEGVDEDCVLPFDDKPSSWSPLRTAFVQSFRQRCQLDQKRFTILMTTSTARVEIVKRCSGKSG